MNTKLLFDLAQEAAALARMAIRNELSELNEVVSSRGKDIKLAIDLKVDALLKEYLLDHSGLSVLSEESGFTSGVKKDSNLRWIVDPLDGSFNFFRSIPVAAVSIALWDGSRPVFGVVSDIFTGDLYTGKVGSGAFLNNTRIRRCNGVVPADGVLCTGFPVLCSVTSDFLEGLILDIQQYKKVRMMGCASLSLAFVASGKADIYQERGIRVWDVAAGLALVLAAGGKVEYSPSNGQDETILDVTASFIAPAGQIS